MKNNDWKERLNVVFSTNTDFKYESEEEENNIETIPNEKQKLKYQFKNSGR